MRIWVPANLAVAVDDPTLNQIVPTDRLDSIASSTCTTPLYQKTAVYATCDFIDGGSAITGVDVTSLVTFTSASPAVAVINNYIQVQCQHVVVLVLVCVVVYVVVLVCGADSCRCIRAAPVLASSIFPKNLRHLPSAAGGVQCCPVTFSNITAAPTSTTHGHVSQAPTTITPLPLQHPGGTTTYGIGHGN